MEHIVDPIRNYALTVQLHQNDEIQCRAIFPEEVWKLLLDRVQDFTTLKSCSHSSPYFRELLLSRSTIFLFPNVLPYIAPILKRAHEIFGGSVDCNLMDSFSDDSLFDDKNTDEIIPEDNYPDEIIPNEIIPDEIIPDDNNPDDNIPDEDNSDDDSPDDNIPDDNDHDENVYDEIDINNEDNLLTFDGDLLLDPPILWAYLKEIRLVCSAWKDAVKMYRQKLRFNWENLPIQHPKKEPSLAFQVMAIYPKHLIPKPNTSASFW